MERKFQCPLCKSWQVITSVRCTNPKCQHSKEETSCVQLPPTLAQLSEQEVAFLCTFLITNGNIKSCAQMLETTPYYLKDNLAKLRNKLETLAKEREILENFTA